MINKKGFGLIVNILLFAVVLASIGITIFLFKNGAVFKSRASLSEQVPDDVPAKGRVYKKLSKKNDGSCPGGFAVGELKDKDGRQRCTHGPDDPPDGFEVYKRVPPISSQTQKVLGATVSCDGDGVSGNRVQMLYIHPSTTDRYAEYLPSFQQWTADMDKIFVDSAKETSGDLKVRFVHDSSCTPIIENVTLSATGMGNFSDMVSELQAKGYNRTDRKYVIFGEASVYCGLGDIQFDDSPGQTNLNNRGPHYARVDSGCWHGMTIAHELMHTMGGVQMTAPHSSLEWHCTDGADVMCRPTNGTPVTSTCPFNGTYIFDCNHDDYYSANPQTGNYLATHWNTANNLFLFGSSSISSSQKAVTTTSTGTEKVATLVTLKKLTKGSVITTSFASRDTLVASAKVLDQISKPVSGASVKLSVLKPDGVALCSLSATTDSQGNVAPVCKLPSSAPKGTWKVHINSVTATSYSFDSTSSILDVNFTVN